MWLSNNCCLYETKVKWLNNKKNKIIVLFLTDVPKRNRSKLVQKTNVDYKNLVVAECMFMSSLQYYSRKGNFIRSHPCGFSPFNQTSHSPGKLQLGWWGFFIMSHFERKAAGLIELILIHSFLLIAQQCPSCIKVRIFWGMCSYLGIFMSEMFFIHSCFYWRVLHCSSKA